MENIDFNESSDLSEEASQEAIESSSDPTEVSEEVSEDSESLESEEYVEDAEGSEESVIDYSEILTDLSDRLENIESVVCASPDPDYVFLDHSVQDLTVTDGLLFLIFLILLYNVINDTIGGLLDKCMRH